MKSPHTNPSPTNTISTTITTSAHTGLPTMSSTNPPICPPAPHLTALLNPLTSAVSMAVHHKFHDVGGNLLILIIFILMTIITVLFSNCPCGLKKTLISCGFGVATLLYGLIWEISWTEKIISGNWCFGEALVSLTMDSFLVAQWRSLKRAERSWFSVWTRSWTSRPQNGHSKMRSPPTHKAHQWLVIWRCLFIIATKGQWALLAPFHASMKLLLHEVFPDLLSKVHCLSLHLAVFVISLNRFYMAASSRWVALVELDETLDATQSQIIHTFQIYVFRNYKLLFLPYYQTGPQIKGTNLRDCCLAV